MSTLTPAEALADAITVRRREALGRKITAYQRKNSILSDVHDCDRYLCHAVLDWDKRPLHDADLQARFDAGNIWEKQVVSDLLLLGFEFQASQMPITITNRAVETIATGKIDGFIQWEGRKIPVEIKSMHPNVFEQIKSVEDFQKRPYLKKYTRQLSLYLFGNNAEFGLFLVTNGLGAWKLLPLTLDLGECEHILQRLERAHEAIKRKEYLDRIPYDPALCGKCPFSVTCLPDIHNRAAEMIENEALEADISRHEEIKPFVNEFKHLHDRIKETFEGIEKAMVGTRFLVMNVPSRRMSYDGLPADKAAEVEALNGQISEIKRPFGKPVNTLAIEDLQNKKTEESWSH